MARVERKKVEPELEQIAAQVPVELKREVEDLAERRERSVAAEVRLALRAWIEQEEAA